MPEFEMDKSGVVPLPFATNPQGEVTVAVGLRFRTLDDFTKAYIEALFWTESAPGVTTEEWQATEEHAEGSIPGDVGYADLAPDALAGIIKECEAFQATVAFVETVKAWESADSEGERPCRDSPESQGGHDFWLTRNGHGAGFWDGDWQEPHASALDQAAKAAGSVDVYLGDDGKVYLS